MNGLERDILTMFEGISEAIASGDAPELVTRRCLRDAIVCHGVDRDLANRVMVRIQMGVNQGFVDSEIFEKVIEHTASGFVGAIRVFREEFNASDEDIVQALGAGSFTCTL